MSKHYPLKYTLEDGTEVEVHAMGNHTYEFTMTGKETQPRRFTIVNDGRAKDEITNSLDFDQLNAVRRYWLEIDNVV